MSVTSGGDTRVYLNSPDGNIASEGLRRFTFNQNHRLILTVDTAPQ